MTLSIVTVTRNDVAGLRQTLKSVQPLLERSDTEWVIIDGASTDGTLQLLEQVRSRWPERVQAVSEPDQGIYDAMNKGWRAASGSHVIFMNGGDTFHPSFQPVPLKHGTVYYGDAEFTDGASRYEKHYSLVSTQAFLNHNCFSHQAIFYPRELLEQLGGYDLQYAVSADFDLTLRAYLQTTSFERIDQLVACCALGGISHTRGLRSYRDRLDSMQRSGLTRHAWSLRAYYPVFYLKHKLVHALEGSVLLHIYRSLRSRGAP